jgi:tripartite ATP-independent transporter DctP family solute receptor
MSELQKTHKTFSNPISWWILNILTTCFIATAICAFTVRSAKTSGSIRVLRLGHGLSADHPVHQAMLHMSERLRELSAGTMELQIFPSGMIGSEDECFKQAQNAQIEFAKCSAAVLDGSVPEFQVVGAPFLFRDSEHFWAVMNGEIGKSLLRKIDGLMGICYFDAGARSLYTTKKPVRSAEDMKGLKIRTQKSSIAMQSMEALGASPTPISWGELYTALSQGTVDAAENNIPSFVTGRHFEVCKYFTFTEHQRVPDVLVMSKKIWDELTAEQKGWIEQAAAEANVFQRQAWRESEVLNEQIAREAGVEFIKVDRAPFMELSKPVYDAFPAELQDLAKRIQEVK